MQRLPWVHLLLGAGCCAALGGAVCVANSDQPACTATATASPAIRREIRDLTPEQWDKFVTAMWAMKTTSLADGIAQYGEGFKPYDYFVVKHAVGVWDSRGDQLHLSDAFGTGHCLLVREFEVNLMLIDPTIEGLPYWDAESDVLNDAYFGSAPGTGPNKEVIDGRFANWPVNTNFSMDDWSDYLTTVAGASNGFTGNAGFLRGMDNFLNTSISTRFGTPTTFAAHKQEDCAIWPECWNDWFDCIDPAGDSNFHSGIHVLIGWVTDPGLETIQGDLMDPSTSPNDPLFWAHHANLDRNKMNWMKEHEDLKESYYGYGGLQSGCKVLPDLELGPCDEKGITGGIELEDTVHAMLPFTSTALNLEGIESEGLTHREALCHFGPETAPYTYIPPAQPGHLVRWEWFLGIMLAICIVGGCVGVALSGDRHQGEECDGSQMANRS